MSDPIFSVIVRCWRDPQLDITRLQVINVDTTQEVLLSGGSFLLRFWAEETTTVALERCLIRHLSSGREAYVQSGPGLIAFLEECLLNRRDVDPMTSDDPEDKQDTT